MRDFLLDLDPSVGRRAGLEQSIRSAIRTGRLSAGSVMPSTRTLAGDLDWSRATVVAAYEQLVAEGYLISHHGSATVVAPFRKSSTTTDDEPKQPTFRFDFRPGEPDASAFPRAAWARTLRRIIKDAPDEAFGYADPRGRVELRTALASYLGRARAVVARPDVVDVFAGFSSALGFVGEVMLRRGITSVAVEDPTLFINRLALEAVGVDITPIPVDDQGLVVDELRRRGDRAVVVTPSHQYPLGIVMSAERRGELLAWAHDVDGWIIEDDYDGEFRYDRQPLGALQGLDPDRVVYAGTASKSFAAGLRLGWLVVPDALRADLSNVKLLRGGVSSIDQLAFAEFIERGDLDRHLRTMRASYRRRQLDIVSRIRDGVPWLEAPDIEAGLHLSCTMPSSIDESALVADAALYDIGLFGLGSHWVDDAGVRGLVIGYSRPAEHAVNHAIDELFDFLAAVKV